MPQTLAVNFLENFALGQQDRPSWRNNTRLSADMDAISEGGLRVYRIAPARG